MNWLRDRSLTIVLMTMFVASGVGQLFTGWAQYNTEQVEHHRAAATMSGYLAEGHFWSALFENWESEFLQMAGFVMLSASLRQRGAAESKKFGDDEQDADPVAKRQPDSPWPVHRGGLALALYSRSLSIALAALFAASFWLHAVGGAMRDNEDAAAAGRPLIGTWQYIGSSTFWFESFQNWQSEFLSVGVLIVLSIFLRQKGSPESKPVHAPHRQTGTS